MDGQVSHCGGCGGRMDLEPMHGGWHWKCAYCPPMVSVTTGSASPLNIERIDKGKGHGLPWKVMPRGLSREQKRALFEMHKDTLIALSKV